MYATDLTEDFQPAWVGEAIGIAPCRIWPATIQHPNGFEPGIWHEIGGQIWREDVPWRMSSMEAAERARNMVVRSTGRPVYRKGY